MGGIEVPLEISYHHVILPVLRFDDIYRTHCQWRNSPGAYIEHVLATVIHGDSANCQKRNIKMNPSTKSLIYHSVLSERYAPATINKDCENNNKKHYI